MKPYSKNIRVILNESGEHYFERPNVKGSITIVGYREYDNYCECDLTFSGQILVGRGPYFIADWIDTNQLTEEEYSFRKIRTMIRKSSGLAMRGILKFFVSDRMPIRIKKVNII